MSPFILNALIEEKQEDIVRLCKQYRMRRIELFASAASRRFGLPTSDIDFLFAFEELGSGEHADAYLRLQEALQDLFRGTSRSFSARDVGPKVVLPALSFTG